MIAKQEQGNRFQEKTLSLIGRQGIVSSWRFQDILVPFVLTRGLLLLIGCLALSQLTPSPDPGHWQFSSHDSVNMWSRWDAGWYLSIAKNGYSYHPDAQSSVNFAPLYPLLMRGMALLLGRVDNEGCLIGGILVSNLALLSALYYLVSLARIDFDTETAARAGLYLLVFPTSFFLSAVYPESLFLALVLAAFYYARKDRWGLAGSAGALAALTRPHGVLILVPLLLEYGTQRNFKLGRGSLRALALGLIPMGFLVWVALLYRISGDPWLFLKTQSAWGRSIAAPWNVLANFFDGPLVLHGTDHSLLDLGFTILFCILIYLAWGRIRPSYVLYATLHFSVTVCSGLLVSTMRYGLEMFPMFLILALAGRRNGFDRWYIIASTGLGAVLLAMFALWYWVA